MFSVSVQQKPLVRDLTGICKGTPEEDVINRIGSDKVEIDAVALSVQF